MNGYRNKYLEMLKAEKSKKHPGKEVPKVPKVALRSSLDNFGTFDSSQVGAFSEFSPPLVVGEPHPCDNTSQAYLACFHLPLDAEGAPCALCPSCNRGEFWRWPKFHKDHDPRGWICWFCSPPPEGSGPCDFCGVPEDNK